MTAAPVGKTSSDGRASNCRVVFLSLRTLLCMAVVWAFWHILVAAILSFLVVWVLTPILALCEVVHDICHSLQKVKRLRDKAHKVRAITEHYKDNYGFLLRLTYRAWVVFWSVWGANLCNTFSTLVVVYYTAPMQAFLAALVFTISAYFVQWLTLELKENSQSLVCALVTMFRCSYLHLHWAHWGYKIKGCHPVTGEAFRSKLFIVDDVEKHKHVYYPKQLHNLTNVDFSKLSDKDSKVLKKRTLTDDEFTKLSENIKEKSKPPMQSNASAQTLTYDVESPSQVDTMGIEKLEPSQVFITSGGWPRFLHPLMSVKFFLFIGRYRDDKITLVIVQKVMVHFSSSKAVRSLFFPFPEMTGKSLRSQKNVYKAYFEIDDTKHDVLIKAFKLLIIKGCVLCTRYTYEGLSRCTDIDGYIRHLLKFEESQINLYEPTRPAWFS